MNKLIRVLAVAVLVGAVGAALLVPGQSSPGAAQEEEAPPPPHAIMVEEKLCVVLLVALANVPSTTSAVVCVNLYSEFALMQVAGFLSQSDGDDTPIFNPDGSRFDLECPGDTNDDGEVCGAGDDGVDDPFEVTGLIDMRDDGRLDGIYTLRASDFAAMDLDSNQLHELDGTQIILVFNDGHDQPVRIRPEAGLIQPPSGPSVSDIACGSATIPSASYFDEDCDDDNIQGDGVKVARMIPGTPRPDRGEYTLRLTETDTETYLDYTVVGEPRDIMFTLLKPVATSGVPEDECRFDLSVEGVVEALANPGLAIVLVHAVDTDGTQVSNTLLHWDIEPEELAFPFLPDTPTVDLGSFGKGFPQAICGDEGTGIAEATVGFGLLSIDPNKPPISCDFTEPPDTEPCTDDPETETIEITVLGPPDAVSAIVATPAEVACDGTQTASLAVTVVDLNGDLVANGTEVTFDIQVLGTANPITATTTDGIATSTITPLASSGTGAPVVITAGDIQTSFLVKCAAGSPVQPGATPATGTGAPGGVGTISGPDTGTGGDAAGRDPLSAWPAVALFVAAMGLVGARYGLRNAR